jgi:ribonuclease HII
MRVLGIDEAGRGCVLGPLVVTGFLVEDPDEAQLKAAGADDSKAMSAKKRDAARTLLAPLGHADIRLITAQQIDVGNLNTLEEMAIADMVRLHKPDLVKMDALGPPSSLPRLIERLQHRIGNEADPDWVVEPKADAKYAIVGAASIFAKTSRDAALDAIRELHGDLGSGYPSDPKTRRWLQQWNATKQPWPTFVRTRWGTVRNLAQQALL